MFIYQNMQSYSTLKKWAIMSKCMVLSERNKSEKGYLLHDSNYMTMGKRSKTMETGESSVVAKSEEGWIGVAQRVVRAVKILFSRAITLDALYTCPNP